MWKKLKKLVRFFYLRILRSKHTPHKVALALAIGVFVGCFVLPGLHTAVVLALAFIFRIDKILSFAATWVANPYTIPFLYPSFCYIGSRFINPDMTFIQIEHILIHTIKDVSWNNFKFIGQEIFFSFLIGGFILGLILSLIVYAISYFLVKVYREKKQTRKLLKRERMSLK